jgi:TadE-like protein
LLLSRPRAGTAAVSAGTVTGRIAQWSSRWERGSATVEAAVVFPAFLALIFTGVQAAEWYHVRSMCLAAADAGVRAARQAGAEPGVGPEAATRFPTRAAGAATDIAVSAANSTPTTVHVQVTATVPRVLPIPGLSLRVSQSAQSAKEVFTVDGQQ